MSKNVNNDVTMNPPVLDRGYWIFFWADTKTYSGIVWTATVHDWNKSFTHIKHRFGVLNTNLHFRLSRLPVVASTNFFRYGSNTCSHCDEEREKLIRYMTIHFKIGAVQHCAVTKIEPKSLLSCVITWFFVSTQELSSIVSEHSLNKKGKSLQLQL